MAPRALSLTVHFLHVTVQVLLRRHAARVALYNTAQP